ncbi:hypothetical protein FRB96_007250 [Tulasnella sp. 330]|nr:hypothetical protein FRB96_007250 [Tulasnella sp. 330]
MPSSEARMFADLIYQATGWWPHLDPTQHVEVGTYGTMNRETGRFHPIANLYEDAFVVDKIPELAQDTSRPKAGEISRKEWAVWTDKDSRWNFNVDPGVTLTGILDGQMKLKFDVAPNKRSAFLIMDGFQTISLPPRGLLPKIARLKELKGMYVVTDIRVCSAYILGLTSKGSTSVSTDVSASLPIPAAIGVTAGGGVGGGWSSHASVTFHEEGSKLPDPRHYTTLLTLKVMSNRWKTYFFGERGMRGAPLPQPAEDEIWTNAPPPWSPLDIDGKEIVHEVWDDPDSPMKDTFDDEVPSPTNY